MKATEMVMEFLRKEGFCPEVDSDNGNIVFKYQMTTFLFLNNDEEDEEFFQLCMPNIYDVTDDNREMVLEAINIVNRKLKVMKATIIGDNVWLFFENLLDQTPDVSTIIPRALMILQGGRQQFYEEME